MTKVALAPRSAPKRRDLKVVVVLKLLFGVNAVDVFSASCFGERMDWKHVIGNRRECRALVPTYKGGRVGDVNRAEQSGGDAR